MVVLEESVVEFVQHPLDMSEIIDKTNIILLDCIENISLSLYISESCLNEGWADLTKGKSTHIKQQKSSFPRMLLLHRNIFCHTGQDNILLFSGKNERAFCNSAHCFKHVALLKGMLYVNNSAYIMQKYWLF